MEPDRHGRAACFRVTREGRAVADVAVVTASFGGRLPHVARSSRPSMLSGSRSPTISARSRPYPEPWNSVGVVSHDPPANPRMTAKVYRMTPWDVLPAACRGRASATTGTSCGSTGMEVISPRFLEEATTSLGVVTDGHDRWLPSLRGQPRRTRFESSIGRSSRRPRSTSRTVRQWKRRSQTTNATVSRRTPGCTRRGRCVEPRAPVRGRAGEGVARGRPARRFRSALAPVSVAGRLPIATFPHDQTPPRRFVVRAIRSLVRRSATSPGASRTEVRIHPHSRST